MSFLKSKDKSIEFEGIGGERMQEEGLKSLFPVSEMSVVGMWEVIKKIGFFKEVMNRCKSEMRRKRYDAFIPVDYPGFNLRLAGFAKSINLKVIYYIAPQLWAWGKNRANKLKQNVDLLLTVFPFEQEFFKQYQIKTEFVGHPLLDRSDYPDILPGKEEREKIISIFPGSRKQEIIKHEYLLREILPILNTEIPDFQLKIAKSKSINGEPFKELVSNYSNVSVSTDSTKLMLKSMAGIVKTGTSNLEAALCGLPISMFYKTSFLSYWAGRTVVNLEHLSLVNILSGRTVINEFIQSEAKPKDIANDLIDLINNDERYRDIQTAYNKIRMMLGEKGASNRAAQIILDFIQ